MNVLIPTNPEFVEAVAKAIGKDRLYRDAADMLKATLGIVVRDSESLDRRLDVEFEKLWTGEDDESKWNRENFMADALTAINRINFMLLTMGK